MNSDKLKTHRAPSVL